MNEQKPPGGIEWTRPYGRRGFTHNPIAGCPHGCRWFMKRPGDMFGDEYDTAICYAEALANKYTMIYDKGFDHIYWHPDRLAAPKKVKEGAGIFLGSMSDMFSAHVNPDWVNQVLDICRETPQHIYMVLTKFSPNLLKYSFPPNVWVGVSSSPDIFMGKEMDDNRKRKFMDRALSVLSQIDVPVRWISLEPLNADYSEDLRRHEGAISWATVGAASNGRKKYPPSLVNFESTLAELDRQGVSVFYKGNMNILREAAMNWRDEFPRNYQPA